MEADPTSMRPGPPPTSLSGASLPSAFFSQLVHASAVLAGVILIPVATSEIDSAPMVYVPIELVSIADSTNMAPVFEKIEESEEPAPPESEEMAAPTPPSAPPELEDTVALDPPKPEPPKPAQKPPPKAAPAPPSKSMQDELADILASVDKQPAPKRADPKANPASADSGPPRRGAGDLRRDTATVTDFISSQLIKNRCWTDHSDMADAKRLTVTIRVAFDRNSKLIMSQLINPAREPINDGPLQTYLAHARRALTMCSKIGWIVPPEYFNLPPANQQLDLIFVPKIATQ
jgi:hypothetical protein